VNANEQTDKPIFRYLEYFTCSTHYIIKASLHNHAMTTDSILDDRDPLPSASIDLLRPQLLFMVMRRGKQFADEIFTRENISSFVCSANEWPRLNVRSYSDGLSQCC